MQDHPAPPAGEAPIPSPQPPDRRLRAIDDAWEAIVREELARIRRNHQRNSRFSRPEEKA